MSVSIVRKSKNEEEEEKRKQLLAQIQENATARKNAEIQAVKNSNVKFNNPYVGGGTYLAGKYVAGLGEGTTNIVSAPMQTLALGFQQGSKQASKEQTTWDKIKNIGKNTFKTFAYADPTMITRLMYDTTVGRDEFIQNANEVNTQIQQNASQADSTWKKATAYLGGYGSYIQKQYLNSGLNQLQTGAQSVGQMVGSEKSQQASQALLQADDKLHEPIDKLNEELSKSEGSQNKVIRRLGNASYTIGNMTPSILISALSGGAGASDATREALSLTSMGISAKGGSTREGLKQGLDLSTAERIGVSKGMVEVGTEKMWNGLSFLKSPDSKVGSAIRTWIGKQVENRIKSQFGKTVLTKWIPDLAGESIEEFVSGIYDNWLDRATVDPNRGNFFKEQSLDTLIDTTLSTLLMNAPSYVLETKAIHDRNKSGNQTNVNTEESNGYKQNLQEMVNNLDIPNEMKAELQQTIDSNETITGEEYNNTRERIKSLVKANTQQQIDSLSNDLNNQYIDINNRLSELDNIKAENFKDPESRRFYAQQINKEFGDVTLDSILAGYPENRNGNRTVKQYKEIAKEYGKQMAENGLTFDEVRANTVGAWQYYEPNKNITRYDNQQKKNASFERLNSQVWSEEVYNSYKDTMRTQLQQQQEALSTQMNDELTRLQDEENILIDTIDNLKPKASPEQVARTKKLIEDFAKARGVNVEYNAEVFKNNNEEGFIKDKGNGERTIYINPNADTDTILVKLATHEMFHDTIRTQPHDKLTQLVMDRLKADENYDMYRQSVVDAYLDELNKLENTNKEALTIDELTDKQNALIDEEMTAKYLGEYLGDEQFVQQLVNSTNRSTIQKIMDWIDNRLQQIKNVVTGNKEAEYWRKVRENFEKAYNSKYQGQEGTQYSKELENADNFLKDNKGRTIQGLEDYNVEDLKNSIKGDIQNILQDNYLDDVNIVDLDLHGSRLRGTAKTNSDLDVVVQYDGDIREDTLFDILNENPIEIEGIKVDINPIKENLQDYMARSNEYDNQVLNIATDNQGRTLTKEQQDYFKNSENRNENGELKEMYRGSKETINVFDKNNKAKRYTNFGTEYETDVKGFYFTDNKEFAEQFGDVKPYYLNTEKILKLDNNIDDLNKIFKPMLDNMLKNQDISQTQYDAILENGTTYKRFIDEDGVDWQTIDDEAFNDSIKIMQELGYDSIAVNEGDDQKSLMVFNSNQIKNVDNLKPTDNPDIRYSKKTKFDEALQQDNKGRELSEEQKEYFKDSKVRDRDGNLITLYHGTDNEVTTFDTNKPTYARYGSGAYLTDGIGIASEFADIRAESNNGKARIIEGYANIDKMFDNTTGLTENTPERQKLFELLKERGLSDRQLSNIESAEIDYPFQLMERYLVKDEVTNDPWIKANTVNELLREAGYNGIKGYYGDGSYEYVTFNPNQIKDIENKKPTTNDDIRYSKKTAFDKALKQDNQGRELSENQQEYFKNSKARDENGNLLALYHGSYENNFNIFDKKFLGSSTNAKSAKGGFFFTDSKSLGEEFAKRSASGKLYETYLNMVNPVIKDFKGEQVNADNELVKLIKEAKYNGNDGVIAYNLKDGLRTDNQYIVFNSNQIKNVDNLNPTENPDIRYSKKTKFDEALKENIETTNNGKNLLALHNLSEENLNNILDLGGFPVPSIAVTNPNKVYHNEFGDYTVVFNKDTINPKATRKNEVYDRDVWSPTFPRIEYEANTDTIKNISKALDIDKHYSEMDSIQKEALRDLSQNEVERWLENAGLDGLKDYIKDNKSIQYAYLKSKGLIEPSTKQVQFYKDYPNNVLQDFINEYNKSEFKDIPLNELSFEQTSQLSDMVKSVVNPYLTEQFSKYGDDGKAVINKELDKFNNYNSLNNFVYSANSMLNHGTDAIEIDKSATLDKIQQLLDKEAYDKWVDENITNEIIKDKGFDNGKERLTELGNRRSFKATHNAINLENLVKALSRGNTKGGQETSIFGTGFGRISAQTAQRFSSIQDIKNNEGRLMSREQATEIIQPLSNQLFEKVDELANYYTRKDYGSDFVNHMQGTDVTSEIVEELASGQLSEERFRKILNEYNSYDTDKIPTKLLNGIINDLKEISNLPTDYFEAKPQRAVTFDEIDTIIIPSNASETTKQRLTDKGIKYIEYDINNENARSDILKALDDYKFNKKAKAFDDYLKANNPNRSGVTIGDLKNLPTKQQKTTQPILPTTNVQATTENLEIPNEQTSLPLGEQVNPSERKQRKAYKSIIESPVMSEEAKKVARKFIGQDTYTPDSNLKQLERADNIISRLGVEKALNQLESNAMEGRTIKAEDIATGDRLIEYYSKIGDSENLQRAIRATAMAGTQAGRSVQAFALLKHQTPQGMAVWIQNSVDKLNSQTKNGQFDFTTEMQEKILNSTEDNLQENVDEVMKELGQQVPQSLLGKLDTWRYFSMLANPKTHIRNIVGNFAMGLTQQVKSKVAGTIEQVTGQDRTHTSLFEKRSRANIDFAKNDLKNVSAQLGIGESKYSNPKNQIQQNQRVFKSDALEKSLGRMFKMNDKLLEAEDSFGLKNAYVRNLSDYMTANKLNPNTITNEQLQQARKVAIEEALRATFHQESSLASMLNQIEKKNLASRILMGGLVPFKKTPINVAKSGFEYSPAGLAKAIVYDSVQLRKGNINVNEYIDNISKGLTGTGIALVGYALAEAGILKAGGDDDKDEKYRQAMGEQEYSINNKPLKELLKKVGINVPDSSYSLDWLAPTGIPLFVGAELNKLVHDTTEKDGETENEVLKAIGRVADATSSLLNPMSEMSMISGLTSTIQSFSSDPGQALMNLVVSPVKSYVGQAVPTALGQVARTTDKYERDTSSTETGLLPKAIDQTKNQIMNKIPGLRQMLPTKKDVWGEEVETQDYFHNAVLPYTEKGIKTNAVDKELNDLFERTGESIYPNTSLSKTVTYEGSKTRLTNQDYNDFKTNYGKTSYKLLEDLTKSKEYKGMSDEQKVQAIKDVYTYANNLNKTEYAEKKGIDFKTPTDVQQVRAVKAYGGKESDYFKYKGITDGLSKDSEKMVALRDSNLSAKSKRAVYSATLGKDDTLFQSTNIDVDEYLGYKTANIQGTKDSNGKTISGTKKTAQLDYINNNISGYENRLLLMGKDYKLSRSQQQDLSAYIDTLDNAEELYTMFDKNFTIKSGSSLGQYGKGNIDLYNRPIVTNSDGSISTVRSMSFEENGKEVLIPTVVNGRVVSDDEAINHYHRTGEYLGKFNSVKEADDYAEKLHEDQEKMYSSNGRTTGYTVYYK